MLGIYDLKTFTETTKGSFWPILGVIGISTLFFYFPKSNRNPNKRQKVDFSTFQNSDRKTVEITVKSVQIVKSC